MPRPYHASEVEQVPQGGGGRRTHFLRALVM